MTILLRLCKGFENNILPPPLIERYLSVDGPALKVALYFISNKTGNEESLSKELSMNEVVIRRSIDFWINSGLIEQYEESKSISPEKIKTKPAMLEQRPKLHISKMAEMALENPEIEILMQEIQRVIGRTMSHDESIRVLSIYHYDDLPVEVILIIASYSKENAKRNLFGYIERVSRQWKSEGIDTVEAAERHLLLMESRKQNETAVANALSVNHSDFKTKEKQYISIWFEEYGYGVDFVIEANLRNANGSIPYINGILKDWHRKGIKTVKETRNEISNAASPSMKSGKGGKKSDDLFKRAIKKNIGKG